MEETAIGEEFAKCARKIIQQDCMEQAKEQRSNGRR